jgi:glycerol-3-phosphate dehydrogenase
LVRHALKERGLMQKNASHLVYKEEFIIPCYTWFDVLQYLVGLKLYDWLAGSLSFGRSKFFSKEKTLRIMPGIKAKGLKGAIRYFDGRFDDSRLAINIAQTAKEKGATLINYMKVTALLKENDRVNGVSVTDAITNETYSVFGKTVINATGVFVDDILHLNNKNAKRMVRPSQGVHLILDKSFLNSDSALMIPKTSDGRVLFAVKWYNHLLVGTTDTPLDEHTLEPRALKEETAFILKTAASYLTKAPQEKDILSVFAGLRPLAAPAEGSNSTKEISRDHKLMVSAKGLITITGGKWTTYRYMAEDTINLAIKEAGLNQAACQTEHLAIHGNHQANDNNYLNIYGSDRAAIEKLKKENNQLAQKLHADFPYTYAEVIWVIRNEFVETVEDVLSRRLRALFIDANAAVKMAKVVAEIMAQETGKNDEWVDEQVKSFTNLASGYTYHLKAQTKATEILNPH